MTPKELLEESGQLFDKRGTLLSLWQEIAEHFYPLRADFTTTAQIGERFADHLMTSFPVLMHRDLSNAFGSMLRPRGQQWGYLKAADEERETNDAKRWMEWATKVQWRAMYDRSSQFVRATKEGDFDFAAFGQCVITIELNRMRNGLLYRNWHLRDAAWRENSDRKIDTVHFKWKPTAQVLKDTFGEDKLHENTKSLLRSGDKKRFTEVDCRRIVMPTEQYEEGKFQTPYVSIYLDAENQHIIEEIGVPSLGCIIPRWATRSCSPYAYSPAAVVGLADARLIQAMTLVLLEAGEKATNPPLIAQQEVVRSDINAYAGGWTWVDSEYDERLGAAIRPMDLDFRGIPIGMDLLRDYRAQLMECWYINKLSLPPADREMTAFETGQRVQEWIRQAIPLFEPMETEYNAALCEMTFDLMFANGGFGSPLDIPRSLQGANVEFRFESPLHDAIERAKGQEFLQAQQIAVAAAEIDPGVIADLDVHTAFRDALSGIGISSKWLRDEREVANILAKQEQQREAMTALGAAGQVATIGKDAAAAMATPVA